MKWRTLANIKVPSLEEWVRAAAKQGQHVHVGSDSLQTGRYTQFVTILALLNPPHGGRAAYSREVVPRITSLRERLLREVWLSVDVALKLTPVVPGQLTVHIDANPQERYMSSKYVQELTALVVSQGFRAMIKPHAWAASHIADHVVRTQGKLPHANVYQMPSRKASG